MPDPYRGAAPRDRPRQVFVKPGEIYLASGAVRVATVLGSCVGTVFYHRGTGLGGLSHAMYPRAVPGSRHVHPAPYYVDQALGLMVAAFRRRGIAPGEIDAYIFGGGALLGCPDDGRYRVGTENFAVARAQVAALGLRLVRGEDRCVSGQRLILDLDLHRIELSFLEDEP
jgi:chemotaxis protein CheD